MVWYRWVVAGRAMARDASCINGYGARRGKREELDIGKLEGNEGGFNEP